MKSHFPEQLRYTKDHEWVELLEDNHARVGITDYAQEQLGDIVFVEVPEPETEFEQGDTFGVVESVKAVSDLYMPVGGKVLEVNPDLEDQPELVNQAPYGDGWMLEIELTDTDEYENLMGAEEYEEYVQSERDSKEDEADDDDEEDDDRGFKDDEDDRD
ncbi:MAG: glycine cleavage system protein GcvH [Candidatus Wallbacteria bacterium]|nr:glycine cleavage system protein GcvH [Candidatus Wallbacteria bacterium]MBI4868165.1 glycine cleavage system protein GcvH [Candidatus Wallbacteria bacterium]